jgi:hypothetical protein
MEEDMETVLNRYFDNAMEEVSSQREHLLICKAFEKLPLEWQDALELGEEPLRPEIEPDFLGHGKDE